MEEIKLQISEKGVMWKIFGRNTNDANGQPRILRNKELHDVFRQLYMSDKGKHKFVQNTDRETTWKAIVCNTEKMVGQQ